MARKPKNDISQKSFVADFLGKTKDATVRQVKEAWGKAGYKGDLNQSIFYTTRKEMGLSSGKPRRGRKPGRKAGAKAAAAHAPASAAHAAPAAPRATGGRSGYLQIERSLDQLIHTAEGLGNTELAEALRHARRRVSSHL